MTTNPLYAPLSQAVDGLDVSRRHPIVRTPAAGDFFEGALLGNGEFGAVVVPRPDAIVIHLGHNAVWDKRAQVVDPDRMGTFANVLTAAEEAARHGRPDEDEEFARYLADTEEGYGAPYPKPFPCGSVLLSLDTRRCEVLGYHVDIATGICSVQLTIDGAPSTVEIFVAADSDTAWVRWSAHGTATLPVRGLRVLPDPLGYDGADGPADPIEAGNAYTRPKSAFTPNEHLTHEQWSHHLAFVQGLPVTGEALPDTPAFRLGLTSDTELTAGTVAGFKGRRVALDPLATHVAPTRELNLRIDLTQDELSALSAAPVAVEMGDQDTARSATTASWRDFWARSAIDVGGHELEALWYRNLYWTRCALRDGGVAPGLFGPWTYRDIGSGFHGDYHFNYNVQQLYWGLFVTGHEDLHHPYLDLLDSLLPQARRTAEQYYGMPGAAFSLIGWPLETTLAPYLCPKWAWEAFIPAWAVQTLWWHYLYTGDVDLLADRIAPFLVDVAQFLLDYLDAGTERLARDDGRLHVYPTVVPEVYGLSDGLRLNVDGHVDIVFFTFAFQALVDADEALRTAGRDALPEDLVQRARAAVSQLVPLPTTETDEGTVWVSVAGEDPDVVYNVPAAAMAVFPCEAVSLSSPADQVDIARRTVRRQRTEGGNDLVFVAMQEARLGQLDLERWLRHVRYCTIPNGTATARVQCAGGRYDDATPFDFMARMGVWTENFAVGAVISECLLQSHDGVIRILPNWPLDLPVSFTELRTRGGHRVSFTRRPGEADRLELTGGHERELTVVPPWSGPSTVHPAADSTEEAQAIHHPPGPIRLSVQTGTVVRISPVPSLNDELEGTTTCAIS
ncbi:glycosyl hydrolase family 95 catalytic domain-containing protein [Streptomyces canus]|uniref:glycosyl hydrolase family 95 catalytic domain-containing protein n=1 Tax=Streptomyces canus TaxID=58343 RepID=UPI002E266096